MTTRFSFPKHPRWRDTWLKHFHPNHLPLSQNHSHRAMGMGLVVTLGLGILTVRFAWISILPTEQRLLASTKGKNQGAATVKLSAQRTTITDRNGITLASTVLWPSIFILPRQLPDNAETLAELARDLGIKTSEIKKISQIDKGFYWFKRQIPPQEFRNYGDLSKWQPFVGVVEEPKRIYPEKDLASHLIGFVGIDNVGLDGVERLYNTTLNGSEQTVTVSRDARGKLAFTTINNAVKPSEQKPPLALSIDVTLQGFSESALREGVQRAKAKGGSLVMMSIDTGELLAVASYPTFDLNAPPDPTSEKRRFRPVMDALELGSVVKPLFIAQALDRGIIKPTDTFNCENGKMQLPGAVIRDTHPHGMLTPQDIIKFSSNICTYKIVQKLGRQNFRDSIFRVGLARSAGLGFSGEWSGWIEEPQKWREIRFANMAFGQGLAVSPLQITHAVSIVAGGGLDRGVRILALPKGKDRETLEQMHQWNPPLQYIRPETSRLVTEMMSTVVEEEGGTGTLAMIPGVSVAGKTGTAQKFSPITHSYSERTSSFVGVFPAENPKIAIAVVIDEPQVRPAYGGVLAGPVFSEVGLKTLRYLNSQGLISVKIPDNAEPLSAAAVLRPSTNPR